MTTLKKPPINLGGFLRFVPLASKIVRALFRLAAAWLANKYQAALIETDQRSSRRRAGFSETLGYARRTRANPGWATQHAMSQSHPMLVLVQLMDQNGWKSPALAERANRRAITTHCKNFVIDAVPEVHKWRNKVAAHFAATDPLAEDSLATLELSIMESVVYQYPYYQVGVLQLRSGGTNSQLPQWALTKTYEDLSDRFWPDKRLNPVQ
jgi:hypothetical protein